MNSKTQETQRIKGIIEEGRSELMRAKQFNNSHDETHKDRIHFSILDKILKGVLSKIDNHSQVAVAKNVRYQRDSGCEKKSISPDTSNSKGCGKVKLVTLENMHDICQQKDYNVYVDEGIEKENEVCECGKPKNEHYKRNIDGRYGLYCKENLSNNFNRFRPKKTEVSEGEKI